MPQKPASPILRTKLQRPPVGADYISRSALDERFAASRHVPFVLVSAPAGYGKSTLVSHWLENASRRSAWLSLDETESDLHEFTSYLVAAVRTLFPGSLGNTSALLGSGTLPFTRVVAAHLSNDLNALDEPFILVLEDYHTIRDREVHELVDGVLNHPPSSMQLILLSRRDPPLSLGSLRAGHAMAEIRMQDLQFTREETVEFLGRAAGVQVPRHSIEPLHRKTEGWAVGLRLVALALQHGSELEALVHGFSGDTRLVQDYLMAEVLSHQQALVRESLFRTSIFERFSSPLFEAVLGSHYENALEAFQQLVAGTGLLLIPLDTESEWYRYHHLFRDLLRRQLEARASREEISELHRGASAWFAEHGFIEEALQHALAGDDNEAAGWLVAENGNGAMNREEWSRIDYWLRTLPVDVIDREPRLVLLKAWLREYQYHFTESWRLAERAEPLVAAMPEIDAKRTLMGEIDALRSHQLYHAAESQGAVSSGERSLALLPLDSESTRGFAICLLGASCQMAGDLDRAYKLLEQALEDPSIGRGTLRSRVFSTLCWVHWMAGHLTGLRRAGLRLLKLGDELDLRESRDFARYFLGIYHYHRNELSEAERYLAPVISRPYLTRTVLFTHAAFALSALYLASGRAVEARALAESVVTHTLETGKALALHVAQAFVAELDWREGRQAEAWRWAEEFDPELRLPMYMFFVPELTLVKVLIRQNDLGSLDRAEELLSHLQAYVERTHNRRFSSEVFALLAFLHHHRGDEPSALAALERSVRLAQPGGFLRLFVDLGPWLAPLLSRLDLDDEGLRYVGQILAAFLSDKPDPRQAPTGVRQELRSLVEPLSPRELEILSLLAERLSNKEIANRLHISPTTVKRHTANMYQKLGVNGRREAVDKAIRLGFRREP